MWAGMVFINWLRVPYVILIPDWLVRELDIWGLIKWD
jgi:hypothetical protein